MGQVVAYAQSTARKFDGSSSSGERLKVYVVEFSDDVDWVYDPPDAESRSVTTQDTDSEDDFDVDRELAKKLRDVPTNDWNGAVTLFPTPRPKEELKGLEVFPRRKRMLEPCDVLDFPDFEGEQEKQRQACFGMRLGEVFNLLK
mmetsp:Transcript_30583/g.60008  ORF Transcript_30583/g.60008 Transcript_30583/m.60008 type:complete len:144 (+) Transcript_30583:145-576(+)|eukprot:CAMPEP_0172698674 /NCGR_PEP_ID=MMETSP1074-20121228/29647_1 /TAXON_ID=2916 /ORGANISM="Ceratium fusus, Strain PA161109" /LENGTH=143 /DNA_ID=CAMNT_0013519751 /DNA_START=75 /DNA_END=506 /DNA_ORIENTATION=-